MTQNELNKILENHKHWINSDCEDCEDLKADLRGAYLRGAKNIPFIPMACPDTGAFIGYKKASGYILKIEILQDARRSSSNSRKCRCDKAKVLEIQNLHGDE